MVISQQGIPWLHHNGNVHHERTLCNRGCESSEPLILSDSDVALKRFELLNFWKCTVVVPPVRLLLCVFRSSSWIMYLFSVNIFSQAMSTDFEQNNSADCDLMPGHVKIIEYQLKRRLLCGSLFTLSYLTSK